MGERRRRILTPIVGFVSLSDGTCFPAGNACFVPRPREQRPSIVTSTILRMRCEITNPVRVALVSYLTTLEIILAIKQSETFI